MEGSHTGTDFGQGLLEEGSKESSEGTLASGDQHCSSGGLTPLKFQ
jgi:hypothetical protein